MMNRNMKIQIVLPFVAIIISLLTVKLINFKPAEARAIGFVPERIDVHERQSFTLNRDIKSPIEIVKAPAKEFPATPLSALAPQMQGEAVKAEKPVELKVSMIVVSEQRRLAIINGVVVKEGNVIHGLRISKIDSNRVLVTDSTAGAEHKTRWVYLEGVK